MKKILIVLALLSTNCFADNCTVEVANKIYRESRGEGYSGMLRVGSVIVNRAKAKKVTACAIVRASGQWANKRVPPLKDYAIAKEIASGLLSGVIKPNTRATHFYATWISKKPKWANQKSMVLVGTWGLHTYYREVAYGKSS